MATILLDQISNFTYRYRRVHPKIHSISEILRCFAHITFHAIRRNVDEINILRFLCVAFLEHIKREWIYG